MGRHSPAVAEHDRSEAGWARAYAAQLAAELPAIAADSGGKTIWAWAGEAQLILEELARG